MATPTNDFAMYCCELLSSVGPCTARRMFGGFGISTGGLSIALVADLGLGEKLWLKADLDTRPLFEAAGCQRFVYNVSQNGVQVAKSMNHYSAPEDAMDSPELMKPWARLALDSALKARQSRIKPAPKKRSWPA
ncbi:DNA transformation protein [Polaromonas sp. OV174]|uniref:TfoX/Sxy family protein n=1 Tax=Polaromonas sp. OV174 TaxID=1855300 RepID=UPI0008EF824C|nr:TfoX/Sxy family protein [Polaromonas sp. OV174]SFB90523.1 DNA transformation protein [Polaromonas sp. OV174]